MGDINIQIKKKDFFIIAAIAVFIIGAGIVIATGSTPSINGHNYGEIGLPNCASYGQVLTWDNTKFICSTPASSGLYLSCTATTCSGVNTCTAICPTGYMVTGGGPIYSSYDTSVDLDSSSYPGLNAWNCYWGHGKTNTCYAVCCRINSPE